MRVIDGLKIAFVSSESYFKGLHTPSMYSTSRETGANVVLLLAPGVTEDSLTDERIREMLGAVLDKDEHGEGGNHG